MIQPPHTAAPNRRSGFSLIEMLIAVGILALLTGLILAGVIRAKKKANEIRVKDDLALIETALSAYKDEFGDIPRFADPASDKAASAAAPPVQGGWQWLDYTQTRGAVLLCRALIGPGPANTNPSLPTSTAAYPGDDGADGPGFRTRQTFNATTGQFSGKVYGPYVDAAKFKIGYVLDTNSQPIKYFPVMLDIYGNAILYYPAAPGNSQGILGYSDPSKYNPASPPTISRFNGYDNQHYLDSTGGGNNFLSTSAFGTLAASCGTPAYLLWSAGADGQFGLVSGKTDDIANFDMPANLKK